MAETTGEAREPRSTSDDLPDSQLVKRGPGSGLARSVHRTLWAAMLLLVAVSIVSTVVVGVAWASWTAQSAPGGNAASTAATVNAGPTPTASLVGGDIAVDWAASTLSNGNPVSGYLVNRYDEATLTAQTVLSACTGTVAATTCTESSVPPGRWVYSVTPVFATSWRGVESLTSNTVAILGPLDHLVLAPASSAIHPGRSQTYAAQGFDAYGSALGDVTSATTFTVDGAACAGATCAPAAAGNHTVTGTDTTATGTATLHVNADLAAYGWGSNSSGQVGDGSTTQRLAPVQVGTNTQWASASAGDSHTIALRSPA